MDFFNLLGKYCDLTVLFEKKSSSERDDSWKNFKVENFKAVFLNGIHKGVAEAVCPSVVLHLEKNKYDHIVVTNFSDPTGIIATTYMKMRNIPYEIESDGAFPGSGAGVKEKIKKIIISGATRYFSTASIHDQYYLCYGAKKDQIKRYPFSSMKKNEVSEKPITIEEKQIFKSQLGIKEDKVILAVGQFIHRKGYDILLKAALKTDRNYGIYIIGGKAPDSYRSFVLKNRLDNIHFIEFKPKNELSNFYKCADLFVHPTREDIWGLVINEAVSYGLPVITTDRCVAGLEMIDSNCGKIIKSESIKQLASAITTCLSNNYNFYKITDIAKKYTIDEMVQTHLRIWKNGRE